MINVKTDFGAKGDGNTDDTDALQAALDAAHGTKDNPHGGSEGRFTNQAVYLPTGWYITSRPLTLHEVGGAHIYGEERLATTIQNNTPGSSVFVTNGFMYSRIERLALSLTGGGDGAVFDMNWDNKGTASLQSNTFADVSMGGGAYGLKIGHGGYMGSEISLLNCYLGGHSVAGLSMGNYNSIAISVIGGNIASCGKGVWVKHGGGMAIVGTGFQANAEFDIHIENGTGDGWDISGARSESKSFLCAQPDSRVAVVGCTHLGPDEPDGYFLHHCGSDITVINSYSRYGKIHGASRLNITNSRFDNPDYDEWYGSIGSERSALPVHATATDFTLKAAQSGTVFTNAEADGEVTFTLPVDTSTPYRIPAGTWFGFAVVADHPLTVKAISRSADVGSYLEVVCLVDGGAAWIVRSEVGMWDRDNGSVSG